MTQAKTLLAATDFSTPARHALERAAQLAAAHPGSRLTFAHAISRSALDNLRRLFGQDTSALEAKLLEQAQHNFIEFGTAERRHRGGGREPFDVESRDSAWRLLDPERDNIEEPQRGINYGESYPFADTTVLYYWRATYWRRLAS